MEKNGNDALGERASSAPERRAGAIAFSLELGHPRWRRRPAVPHLPRLAQRRELVQHRPPAARGGRLAGPLPRLDARLLPDPSPRRRASKARPKRRSSCAATPARHRRAGSPPTWRSAAPTSPTPAPPPTGRPRSSKSRPHCRPKKARNRSPPPPHRVPQRLRLRRGHGPLQPRLGAEHRPRDRSRPAARRHGRALRGSSAHLEDPRTVASDGAVSSLPKAPGSSTSG